MAAKRKKQAQQAQQGQPEARQPAPRPPRKRPAKAKAPRLSISEWVDLHLARIANDPAWDDASRRWCAAMLAASKRRTAPDP